MGLTEIKFGKDIINTIIWINKFAKFLTGENKVFYSL